jgi:hypothetical protein
MIRVALFVIILFLSTCTIAQESPYLVTYDHHLEDAGDLEISVSGTSGLALSGQRSFFAPYVEVEYGVKDFWTSSLYVESQLTPGDSPIFTGWRFENRFLPIGGHHRVNPVVYLEYENVNEASRIEKEIVGFAPLGNEPNSELKQVRAKELEGKLILSSDLKDLNLAANFIIERNLSQNEGFEFGYAFGMSRMLTKRAIAGTCRFCRNSFAAGLEFYGGLGSSSAFGLHETAHYAGPAILWQVSCCTSDIWRDNNRHPHDHSQNHQPHCDHLFGSGFSG